MRYKVAVVDDDKQSANLIKSYLNRYSEKFEVIFDIFEYTDGDDLVNEYTEDFDIIFLDIEMKRMNGMETAQSIRKIDDNVIIIFITNMAQYAIKGYSVKAMSFLLKPVPYFSFSQELSDCIKQIESKKASYIVFSTDTGIHRINTKEIYYIEVMKHTLIIHTKQEDFSMRGTIKDMEDKLKEHHFVRCNNCFLVNLAMVTAIKNEYVYLAEYQLKLSRSRKKGFMDELNNYVGRII